MDLRTISGSFLSVLGPLERLPLRGFNERTLAAMQCKSGALSQIFDYVRDWSGEEVWDSGLFGAACEFDPADAEIKALAEAAERYTSSVLSRSEVMIASADDLGDAAFDWARLPQLSGVERSDPLQMLIPFSPQASMRWIETIDMQRGRTAFVPLVLTHLYPRAWSSEQFIYPISTGTAVHPDAWKAMVSATLEVIERDALSLNWLLRRPLKRIRLTPGDSCHFDRKTWALLQQKDLILYDATTDIGIPIVYARRRRPTHPRVANVFGCACDFDLKRAMSKAAREAIMIAHALESNHTRPPEAVVDCRLIIDGACTMMAPDRQGDLAFLDEGGETSLNELLDSRGPYFDTPDHQMRWLVDHLVALDQPFYMTELTCDELVDVGLRAFRAMLPGLMPLSFVYRARFLGSTRLTAMFDYWGMSGDLQDRINPWPQPFS